MKSIDMELREMMQEFAPHAYSESFDYKIEEKIEVKLRKLAENPENYQEIQKIFRSWKEIGSSSEEHFAKYFSYIVKK